VGTTGRVAGKRAGTSRAAEPCGRGGPGRTCRCVGCGALRRPGLRGIRSEGPARERQRINGRASEPARSHRSTGAYRHRSQERTGTGAGAGRRVENWPACGSARPGDGGKCWLSWPARRPGTTPRHGPTTRTRTFLRSPNKTTADPTERTASDRFRTPAGRVGDPPRTSAGPEPVRRERRHRNQLPGPDGVSVHRGRPHRRRRAGAIARGDRTDQQQIVHARRTVVARREIGLLGVPGVPVPWSLPARLGGVRARAHPRERPGVRRRGRATPVASARHRRSRCPPGRATPNGREPAVHETGTFRCYDRLPTVIVRACRGTGRCRWACPGTFPGGERVSGEEENVVEPRARKTARTCAVRMPRSTVATCRNRP
jgi:hypothetical protein